jgi:hypothetical protein
MTLMVLLLLLLDMVMLLLDMVMLLLGMVLLLLRETQVPHQVPKSQFQK